MTSLSLCEIIQSPSQIEPCTILLQSHLTQLDVYWHSGLFFIFNSESLKKLLGEIVKYNFYKIVIFLIIMKYNLITLTNFKVKIKKIGLNKTVF